MKVKHILTLFIAAPLFLIFQSCNEQPTGLGFLLLNDTISIKSVCSNDIPLIDSTKTIVDKTVIFNSSCIYIGKTDSMNAISMLRFQYIPDSLADLSIDKISDCYLELYPNRYAIGDTGANNLSFNVFKVIKYWTAKTTCDSLFDANGNSDYFDNTSQGSFSGNIPYADTIPPIKINLNKQLLLDWFAMARDSVINWGIVLIPNENTSVLRQFSAQAITESFKHSTITMIYKNQQDSTDTLTLTTGIDASVVCNLLPETDNMIVQGGIINQSEISFDLSKIPPEAGILHAELEVTLNESLVKKGNMPLDSIIRGSLYYNNNYDSTQQKIIDAYRVAGTNKFLFPNLVEIIEGFIRNGGKGKIYLEPEGWNVVQRLDRMPFYGIKDENPEFRPKLKIVYSTRFIRKND